MGSRWTNATRQRIRRLASTVFRAAKEAGVDDVDLAKILDVKPKTLASWREGDQPRGEERLKRALHLLRAGGSSTAATAVAPNGDASGAAAATEWMLGYRAGFADGFDRGRSLSA